MSKPFRTFLDLIFLFLVSLTPLGWFADNQVVTGQDSAFPLNPIMHFVDRLFLWTNRFGFGKDQTMEIGGFFIHGQEALLKFLGFSLQTEQKIIFISWFFLLGFSLYIFSRTLFNYKRYPYLGILAALFYMFNSFTLQSWPVVERTKFSVMIATPLLLSVLYKFLDDKLSTLKAAILITLTLFVFNAAGANGLPLNGGLLVALFLTLVFFFRRKIIPLGFLTILLFFLLNAYWLLPFGHFTSSNLTAAVGARGSLEGLISWLRMVSAHTSVLNLVRLQGDPGWYGNLLHPYGHLYLHNWFLIGTSFLWPLCAFGALLVAAKEERKKILFLTLLALVGIFFAAGSHPPSGILFEFIFQRLPGFLIFRSAFYKFNYVISLSYALLIAYWVSIVMLWLKTKIKPWASSIVLLGFMAILGIYNFPYFNQEMFVWNKPLSLMLTVPNYVRDFGKWVNTTPPDTRFLILPPLNKEWSAAPYDWGYFGSTQPTSVLVNRVMYQNNTNVLSENQIKLLTVFYDNLLSGDEEIVKQLISLLGVKYLILQKDISVDFSWVKLTSWQDFERRLANLSWLTKDLTFGKWQVYKVKEEKQFSPFSLVNNIAITNLPVERLMVWITKVLPKEKMYLETTDNRVVNTENFLWRTECLNCEITNINYFLPEVKILPDSYFYDFLVARKEKKLLDDLEKLNFSQRIDLYLGLSLKRMAEVKKLAEAKKWFLAVESLEKMSDNLVKINNLLLTPPESEIVMSFIDQRLLSFSKFLKDNFAAFSDRNIKEVMGQLLILENRIEEQRLWKESSFRRVYVAEIPLPGRYQVEFLDKQPMAVEIALDGKIVNKEEFITLPSGQHQMEIIFPKTMTAKKNLNPVLVSEQTDTPIALPIVKIKKVNQTKYFLTLENTTNDFWLNFADSFNKNCRVYLDGKLIPEEHHFQANGFANAWLIKTSDLDQIKTHTLTLSYFPQKIFLLGVWISIITLAILVFLLVFKI